MSQCQCQCRNSTHFSGGLSSFSDSPRKHIPVDRGSPYTASQVEDWGCRHWRFRVKVHIVQLLVVLPHPHSRGVHRLSGFMATIATSGLSSLPQITYTAQWSWPSTAVPGGFVSVCRHLPIIGSPLPTHFSETIQIPYCMSICLAGHQLTCDEIASKTFRYHLNSSHGVYPSWSGSIDMMFTQTPAKQLSGLVQNVCCWHIVRLP